MLNCFLCSPLQVRLMEVVEDIGDHRCDIVCSSELGVIRQRLEKWRLNMRHNKCSLDKGTSGLCSFFESASSHNWFKFSLSTVDSAFCLMWRHMLLSVSVCVSEWVYRYFPAFQWQLIYLVDTLAGPNWTRRTSDCGTQIRQTRRQWGSFHHSPDKWRDAFPTFYFLLFS